LADWRMLRPVTPIWLSSPTATLSARGFLCHGIHNFTGSVRIRTALPGSALMNSTPILIQPDIVTLSPAVNLALCASVVQSPTIDRGKTRPAATSPAALPRQLFCTENRQAKQSGRLEPLNGAAARCSAQRTDQR